jgi:hypothetical protein
VEHQKPIYLALQVVIIGLFILFLFWKGLFIWSLVSFPSFNFKYLNLMFV